MFSSKVVLCADLVYEFFKACGRKSSLCVFVCVISGPSCRQPRRSALNFTVLAAQHTTRHSPDEFGRPSGGQAVITPAQSRPNAAGRPTGWLHARSRSRTRYATDRLSLSAILAAINYSRPPAPLLIRTNHCTKWHQIFEPAGEMHIHRGIGTGKIIKPIVRRILNFDANCGYFQESCNLESNMLNQLFV